MNAPIIKINNLSKHYSINTPKSINPLKNINDPKHSVKIKALNNISLEIFKNETIGIIGDNGASQFGIQDLRQGVVQTSELLGLCDQLLNLAAGARKIPIYWIYASHTFILWAESD